MSEELDLEPQRETAAADPVAPAKSQKKTWIVATAVSLALGVGAIAGVKLFGGGDKTNLDAASASANQPANGAATVRAFGNAGKITALDGDSFTLQSQNFNGETQTVKVQTDDDTTFTEVVEGSASQLTVGQSIIATGTTTDGVLTADRINPGADFNRRRPNGHPPSLPAGQTPPTFQAGEAPPNVQNGQGPAGGPGNFQPGNFVGGEITKIDGDTITVKDMSGETKTVKVVDATKVMVTKSIKLGDLKVGDNVRVEGETKSNVLQADAVSRGDFMGPGGLRGAPVTQQNGTNP